MKLLPAEQRGTESGTLKIQVCGTCLEFEQGGKVAWILCIDTPAKERNKGQARKAIHLFKVYCESKGLKIDAGTFTEDGEKYISKYFK